MPEIVERLSDLARPDMDSLLAFALSQAKLLIKKQGEFYPFGAAVTAAGEQVLWSAYDGTEHPPSQDLIALLVGGLREAAKAGSIRASAICLDVRVVPPNEHEKTDAVAVRIEHRSGVARAVYLPYRKKFLGRVTYGTLFATTHDHEVFSQSDEGAAT